VTDFVVCRVRAQEDPERGRFSPYLTPLGTRPIEGSSFALLGGFTLRRCRYRFLPDNRFREIGILPPTDPTIVTQYTAGKPFRCFPPLRRLPGLTRRAQHVAPRLLYDRTFGVVINHGRRWSLRPPIGGTLLPDLGVDLLEFRAVGSKISL
jgi:hypothetical protein